MNDYVGKVLAGDRGAGARLMRLLEEERPEGLEALRGLYPRTGRAFVVGVTGPAGVGKSSLIDRVIGEFRQRGLTVGVVAIDPSSPFSGGAILGDRIRMQRHSRDDGVFVRSMATRGRTGGLSRAAYAATLVLDAMGFDVILVETVGVGQDEFEIIRLAQTTVVVGAPGLGDDIQAMKAGLLEVGDVFVVNKADREGADEVSRQLEGMLVLRRQAAADWKPPVLRTSATTDAGTGALVDTLLAHRRWAGESGQLRARTEQRELHFFRALVEERAMARIRAGLEQSGEYRRLLEELTARHIDPYSAADTLVEGIRVE